MINLFSSYYDCGHAPRQKELDACLRKNIGNPHIDRLILFIDDGTKPPISSEKLTIVSLDQRPTYRNWIEHSEAMCLRGITLLANSDIYFDQSILRSYEALHHDRTFLALSRWEVGSEPKTPQLHPNPHWSQDVWGYKCNQNIEENLRAKLGFSMGVPRCDNKIAYLFSIYGWSVSNPCRDLGSFHLHETGHRTYDKTRDDRIMGSVAYVEPTEQLGEASILKIDVWTKDPQNIESLTLNQSFGRVGKKSAQKRDDCDEGLSQPKTVSAIIHNGRTVFSADSRFEVYKHNANLAFIDILSPTATYIESVDDEPIRSSQLASGLFPPVLDTAPISVTSRPKTHDDVFFWQYPCSTEQQAYHNHLSVSRGSNVDHQAQILHCYMPLPWATFSDKAWGLDIDLSVIKRKMRGWQKLSTELGYKLRVHTVCQHIHWAKDILPYFAALGITDLHLSHLEGTSVAQLDNKDIELHSWPLIAVNVENEQLSDGLDPSRDVADRQILASFIGSHMKHYRSNVRLEIARAAQRENSSDILVELRDQWHFNQVVYEEQAENKIVSEQDQNDSFARTKRYNEIISNSRFSLCPEGAGPNSLRIWESMAVGAIPVVIAEKWIAPDASPTVQFDDLVIRVNNDEILNIFAKLRKIPENRVRELSAACMNAYKLYRTRRCF